MLKIFNFIRRVFMRKSVEFITDYEVNAVEVNIKAIKDWCHQNNYSVSEFCRVVGINRASFYQYQDGKSPSLPVRDKLVEITGISRTNLFKETDKPQRGRQTSR